MFKVAEVVKVIIDLSNEGGRAGMVGNRSIYEAVTGLKRYSKKSWDILKPVLQVISEQRMFEIDGVKYQLTTYCPMFASHWNFYRGKHLPESFIWGRPCAGFQVYEDRST